MDSKTLQDIKEKILSGEISLREAAKKYEIDRDTLKRLLEEQIEVKSEAEEFRKRLKYNKENASTIELSDNMKKIIISILKGDITAKEASIKYNIDRETIREKINQFVSEDDSLLREYIEYKNKSGRDYSSINFRGLIIHMMKKNMSQSEMAKVYKIPARTVSRELDKIGKSTEPRDIQLYNMAKRYGEKKMKKIDISNAEIKTLSEKMDALFGDVPIIEVDGKSKEDVEIERLTKFFEQVQAYRKKGMTLEKIAEKMQVSVSMIRRNRVKLKSLNNKKEITQKIEGR